MPNTAGPQPAAVIVRGARKCYAANKWVLDRMDLTVPEGNIYALLGASGCGKTTLLTCLLGLRSLNGGHVRVLGWRPGHPTSGIPGPRLGFMPQELALSEGCSIGETLYYFGRVAGMSHHQIAERSRELLDFLQIPARNSRLICQLSGGQKQRVSLAVTLLHAPPLLILDEPTVGVDPILRQSIWDYLVELATLKRTTIIITTHYIEEARQAHLVGMMRRGKLLVEAEPNAMMARYECNTLEDVFLALSVQQDRGRGQEPVESTDVEMVSRVNDGVDPTASVASVVPVPFEPHSNVMVCLWRAWLLLVRYKWVTAYVLFMPVMCLLFFNYAVGREVQDVHLAIVNEDSADDCAAPWPGYPRDCAAAPGPVGLSCRYVELLADKGDFIMDWFPDERGARDAVEGGDAWAMVHFPANFSLRLARRQLRFQDAEPDDFTGSECDVRLDMSDNIVGNLVRTALFETSLLLHADIQKGCGLNPRFTALGITEEEPVWGSTSPVFQDFALPGTLMAIMYFPAIFFSTANFLEDKLNGVMHRATAAGVTQTEVLVARAVVDCFVMAINVLSVAVTTFGVLDFHNRGSYFTVGCLMYVEGLCGLWMGYFVAAVCESHYNATFLGTGIFLSTVFVSGIMWPKQGLHDAIRWSAPLTPMLPGVEAVRSVLYQGSDGELVGLGFLAIGTWIALLVLATLALLRFSKAAG